MRSNRVEDKALHVEAEEIEERLDYPIVDRRYRSANRRQGINACKNEEGGRWESRAGKT
jgi:hypothetical protein